MRAVKSFFSERSGSTAIEGGLILALIGIVIASCIVLIGPGPGAHAP